jgi:hypothetical protein
VLGCERCECKDVGWAVLIVVQFLEPEMVGFVSTVDQMGIESVL